MAQDYTSFPCGQPHHFFAKRYEGEDRVIGAYHSNNSECKGAEFDVTELLEDELPQMFTCPWCNTNTIHVEHMRRCFNYQTPMSRTEIMDAYSEPCEAAKRAGMLREIERDLFSRTLIRSLDVAIQSTFRMLPKS